jgi:hypothetical protein
MVSASPVRTRTVGKPHRAIDVPLHADKKLQIAYKKSHVNPRDIEDFGSLFKCLNSTRDFGIAPFQ